MATAGILAIFAWFNDRHQIDLLMSREVGENTIIQQRMGRELEQAIADLQTLSRLPQVLEWVESPSPRSEERMVAVCSAFSRWHKSYDHVRFIDARGMEGIRVNLLGDKTVALPKEKLKYKGDRDFFTETVRLAPGEVYITRLDLNMGRDPGEPVKSTVRLATPVLDTRGGRSGVLVINFVADGMLSWLEQDPLRGGISTKELLNGDGYWLHSPTPADEWAFMYGKETSFARSHPDDWVQIAAKESGQFMGAGGLVTFQTIHMPTRVSASAPHFWKLVSRVSQRQLGQLSWVRQRGFWMVGISLLGMMALVSAGLATAVQRGRMAEEAMVLSRFTADHVADALVLLGPEGRIADVNHRSSEILGYSRDEFLGMGISDLDPSATPERWAARCKDLEMNRSVVFESAKRAKGGRLLPVEVHSNLFRDKDRTFICDFVRDITDRKRAEDERRQLQVQLHQAQKMEGLGSLAGGVAHDMNNVLGAILGLASASFEALPEGAPARQAFETIVKAAERGGKMVKSLLNFARQIPSDVQELDLNAVLREEVRLLERTTLSRVRLEMDLAPDLRPVRGDSSALTHAFMNLCVNAVDAMADSGTLTLRTRNAGEGWVEVVVEDTGCGMSKEVLEKAVDPFFTTKSHGKGTGLGLSIVYSTLKVHHGQLEIQSEPGRGTSVVMRFPSCEPGVPAAEPVAEARRKPARERLSVLLVDDDELIQSSMLAILKRLGHEAATAWNGEEALKKLESGLKPDLIILDMNMPGLGGSGTLPLLRASYPSVPVLLATGRADQAAWDLVGAHPGVTLLSKPFSLRELKQRLDSLAGA